MKTKFKLKLIQVLYSQKNNPGFTLVELLVVVVVIGILAIFSFPSLFKQIYQAREVEAKYDVGTLIRAEQAQHWETGKFVSVNESELQADNPLGITIESKYYRILTVAENNQAYALAQAKGKSTNQLRNYWGGIKYINYQYANAICQTQKPNDNSLELDLAAHISNHPQVLCPDNTVKLK
ncbi:MAG: type IV pilin-like G/H family protein [Prochloraceae cyanobacterium]